MARRPDPDPPAPDFFWDDCEVKVTGLVRIFGNEEEKLNLFRRFEPLAKELGFGVDYIRLGSYRTRTVDPGLPRASITDLLQAVRRNPGFSAAELGRVVYAVTPWTADRERIAAQRVRAQANSLLRERVLVRMYSPADGGREPRFLVRGDAACASFSETRLDARRDATAAAVRAMNSERAAADERERARAGAAAAAAASVRVGR